MFKRIRGDRDASRALAGLVRRSWVILLVGLIAGGGAYALAKRQPKTYSATAALLFQTSQLDQKLFGNQVFPNIDPTRTAATNATLVALPAVARQVAQVLHLPTSIVRSEIAFGSDTQSDVMTVTALDRSPARAARLANTYVGQYIVFRQDADKAQLAQAQRLVRSQLAALPKAQSDSATAQSLRQRAFELQLLASLQTGNAEVVQTATTPRSPTSPTPSRDAILGLILGLLAGGAFAFVLERRDRTIKSIAEVEEVYGVPVIGAVPDSSSLRRPGGAGSPRDQDAFRMIRTQLRYFDVRRSIKRIMVTSSDTGEGKSLVSLNIVRAVTPADDKRALLIEADLRRPSLAAMLNVASVVGLSELLSHSEDVTTLLEELVVTVEPTEERSGGVFDLLLAGGTPPNPVELLASRRMSELMEYAASFYDIVIIDTPPIGVVSDPIPLVHQVDGVVVVSRIGRTPRDHAAALMKQLVGLSADVLGVVVNAVPFPAGREYGYYGYSAGDGKKPAARWRRGRQTTKSQ